ncbi:dienelactone hydrolase family protein [Kineosporia sp. J2-2]|uniref:Dienelactone hydrolase family protein n=1 Tax=Kineosporia corallincola TaxID=2835133 RepID=A0ABS5TK56_9ACTN|nr:dienelactone hydrolase family protein [Kineosporia corallincola]MBT0771218.1 dienelactone hydrolase family protein [Kineosporia corallincola]
MTEHSVHVGDRKRTFTLVGDAGPDLVLIFHGSTQTGAGHRKFTGRAFDRLAEKGALVAYLDGHRHNWNDARRESFFPARTENIDDVGFVRAVIAQLVAGHGVDRRRVFAVGYSNGGQMVMRLIHEVPELIAGAAVFAATMPVPESFLLPSPAVGPVPMPVLLVHGTADPVVPYQGGTMQRWKQKFFKVGGTALSMPATARYFAAHNGIETEPVTTRLPARSTTTSVERTEFREGERPHVVLYTVHGGGHTVPHPGKASRFFIGRTSADVNAAELVATEIMDR